MQIISKAKPAAKVRSQDFWLVYTSDYRDPVLSDAVHALYFLPANYKLMIVSSSAPRQAIANSTHTHIAKRVRLTEKTGLSTGASPFSFGSAEIYPAGAAGSLSEHATPVVIVARTAASDLEDNGWNGFIVPAGKPEAIASAMLKISRTLA